LVILVRGMAQLKDSAALMADIAAGFTNPPSKIHLLGPSQHQRQ